MWTPKRVLLLLGGFVAFATIYGAYALFLGGIDGLPPLPEEYLPGNAPSLLPSVVHRRPSADLKLAMAFGAGWEENLKSSLRLEVKSKNLVLATKDFVIADDGRVRLAPFNIAVFGKDKGDGKFPEINTVQSAVAFLKFDKPVSNFADIGRHKIIACELQKDIRIRNNRRSVQQDDDLSLFTQGPMFYQEEQHLVSTSASVRLLDEQSKPEPTTITADGMDLHLTAENDVKAAAPATPRKEKAQSIGGVESVHLLANVEMHLWPDSSSGFLGGTAAPPDKEAKDKAPEKAQLVIMTHGPFRYVVSPDNTTAPDRAYFDIPDQRGPLPEKVKVTRLAGPAGQEKRDQLDCHHLELSFSRKADAAADKDGRSAEQLAIQDAHATGQLVELTSQAEELHAIGNDFFYNARTKESVLKGIPEMVAMKDGHEIYAQELRMASAGQKDVQKAWAKGPGRIAMLNRESVKRTMFARWQDDMEFTKDGAFDCLTFTGRASFEDKEHDQELRADRLRLWLQPAERIPVDGEAQRMKPHRLEATGHVRADSQELHVKEPTEHLVIWFKDAPPGGTPSAVHGQLEPATRTPGDPPRPNPAASAEMPTAMPSAPAAPAGNPAGAERSLLTLSTGVPANKPATADAKKPPMELSARTVNAYVIRTGEKNDLDRVWCQGAVHVHQEPSSPEDRGVDIRGETLQLQHSPEGSLLVVTGNLAEVQMNKICIMGPDVTIDQKKNTATVNGIGAMQMITDKNLDGENLPQPTELTIHWNKEMFFDGTNASFLGGIQADQVNARLACKELQVSLDRPVSFKEGEKGSQPAKVKKLVCDRNCRIEDSNLKDRKLQRYTRLTSPSVALDNEGGIVRATGPGVVHIHQLETEGDNAAPGAPPKPSSRPADPNRPASPMQLVLTRVSYLSWMYADNRNRTAFFHGDVDVVHVPTENADLVVDLDHQPPGCMHLHCEHLKVFSRRQADGTITQEMEAEKKVVIDSQEFWGRAEVVKYDESLDRVILEGRDGGVANLYRTKVPAGEPSKLTGKKIFYWRKTGKVHVQEGQGINVN